MSEVISTKPKNTCPDCIIRVETYLKSTQEWQSTINQLTQQLEEMNQSCISLSLHESRMSVVEDERDHFKELSDARKVHADFLIKERDELKQNLKTQTHNMNVMNREWDMMVKALEKYADGSAFDFNRTIQGKVNFDSRLSSAVARETLQKLGK